MSIGISFSVQDNATPAIEAKLAKCSPARLRGILGPGLVRFTQNHLLANGTNKRGWPTTNFWSRAAKATSYQDAPDGLVISINQIGVRQRYYGGPIGPVTAKALAIPISPVSYGHLPSDFPGLFLLKTKKGAYLVQRSNDVSEKGNVVIGRKRGGNAGRRQRADLNFLFKLSFGVNQPPDESVIPSTDEFAGVAMELIQEAVA